jgi:hypothetical protein
MKPHHPGESRCPEQRYGEVDAGFRRHDETMAFAGMAKPRLSTE